MASRLRVFSSTLTTPGHARQVLLRRFLAVLLLVAAAASALLGIRERPEVFVFAREVKAGQSLALDDIALRRQTADALPNSALQPPETTAEELAGSVVVAGADSGEIITSARLLSEALTATLVQDVFPDTPTTQAHLVPVKLAEPDIIPLLSHGDTVSIITTQDPDGEQENRRDSFVVATGARIVSTAGSPATTGASPPATILVALPSQQAQAVASASLNQPLTVTITGERALAARNSID